MNKKIIICLIPVLILIGISAFLGIYVYSEAVDLSDYFEGNKQTALLEQVSSQKEINERLSSIANDKKYTLEKAYIELNPYKISPLSAIIIFQTDKDNEVNVYINGDLATKTEKSKKHIIPIYGLFEDYENIIELEIDDKKVEYKIKTEKSNLNYPLDVIERTSYANKNNIYFTVASYETYLTGWDIDGNLRFYLTVDNRMDVEWLDNGHFLIGTSQGQFAENFVGFVEMDYLGKIYNYYTMDNGYSFEFQKLNNGNYLAAGGVKAVYITEQVIYEMNPKSGKVENLINLSKIFKEIDSSIPDTYLAQKAIRNGFYLNEETRELVVSFRGIDTVFSINYDTKKLNWIFTNPDNEIFKSNVWDKYKVELVKGRYPEGQHSPQITKEGYIAFFNNGYVRYTGFENGGPDNITDYRRNYSSGEIYEIKDMKAKLIWEDNQNKKAFSHQYGSIRVYDDGSKLIDYGYTHDTDYRNNKEWKLSESEQNPDHIHALIVEYDENDNLVFKAKSEEGKYRAFKHTLYNELTSNTKVEELSIFNEVAKDELDMISYKDKSMKELNEWIYSLDFTQNTFKTNYAIQPTDEIKLYFMNEIGKIYVLNYKSKDIEIPNRIFNVSLSSGDYALFININGITYKTNKVITY